MCSYWRFKSLRRSFLFSLCFLKCFGIISGWKHTVIRSLDTFPRLQHCACYVTNLRIASPEITLVHCTSFAREHQHSKGNLKRSPVNYMQEFSCIQRDMWFDLENFIPSPAETKERKGNYYNSLPSWWDQNVNQRRKCRFPSSQNRLRVPPILTKTRGWIKYTIHARLGGHATNKFSALP